MKDLWKWLNGHKTEIGGVVLFLSVQLPELFNAMGIDPATTDTTAGIIAGSIITTIGIAHKILKGIGWAEPVKYVK